MMEELGPCFQALHCLEEETCAPKPYSAFEKLSNPALLQGSGPMGAIGSCIISLCSTGCWDVAAMQHFGSALTF